MEDNKKPFLLGRPYYASVVIIELVNTNFFASLSKFSKSMLRCDAKKLNFQDSEVYASSSPIIK